MVIRAFLNWIKADIYWYWLFRLKLSSFLFNLEATFLLWNTFFISGAAIEDTHWAVTRDGSACLMRRAHVKFPTKNSIGGISEGEELYKGMKASIVLIVNDFCFEL